MKAIRIIMSFVFVWSALKGAEMLCRTTSVDLQILKGAGFPWLFYLLIVPCLVCYILGVVWIWRPYPKGFLVSMSAVVLNLIETTICVLVSVVNTELAKEAFIVSRESRGLPVRPEVLQIMESPVSHLLPLGISVVFGALWIFLLLRIEKHHRQSAAESLES